MNIYLQIAISLISGGLAGAIITSIFNTRTRFWSRFYEFQKLVIEKPYLYPIWDQAGNPKCSNLLDKWNSNLSSWISVSDYMISLNSDDERYIVLTFIEAWGEFIIESHNLFYKMFLGRHYSDFTIRAREICFEYDLFPAEDSIRNDLIKINNAPNGRNGQTYGKKSLKILGLLK
jgi:hypothetical protein